jgi:cytochrome P450
LGWILLELAAHPDEQREVRNEVCAARAAEHPDGIGMTNLDALPLLNAVIKVNATHVYLTLA